MESSNESFEPKTQPEADGPNKPPRTPGTRVGAGETPGMSDVQTIRTRPGVFIGSTNEPGLHHLINALLLRIVSCTEESSHIELCINGNSSVTISVDKSNWLNAETAFELSETSLNSSFMTIPFKDSDRPYRRIASRGVSLPFVIINALCEYLYVEATHEGLEFRKKFVRGSSWGRLSSNVSQKPDFVSITLLPDDEIFQLVDKEGNAKPVELSQKAFSSLLRQAAYLNRGRKFSLKDYRPVADVESEVFQFNDGIAQYVLYLNEDRRILHEQPIYFATTVDQVFIECALQWTDLYSKSVYSFVNGITTTEGGTHVSGFSSGVRITLIEYGRSINLIDENEMMLYFDDFAEGLTAIINVRMEGAELTGKTLEYLSNSKVQEIAQTLVSDGLWDWLKENPEAAELIVRKGLHTADYNRKHGR